MTNFGLHKRGKFFWTEFRIRGQRVYKSTKCTNEEDAEVVAARWYNDLAKESQGVWIDHGYTVKDLWDSWWKATAPPILSEAHRKRVSTDWLLHILPRFGDRPAKGITTADAEHLRREYLAGTSLRQAHQEEKRLANLARKKQAKKLPEDATLPSPKPRSVASSNKLLLHFHLVFSWAVHERRALEAVPFDVKVIKVQEKVKSTLERHQVRAFLALVDASDSPHAKIAIRAMLYWALREAEALALRWEWFGPELATFQHGERKAKDAPRFPVPEDLRRLLVAMGVKTHGLVLPALAPPAPGKKTRRGMKHDSQFTAKIIHRAGLELGLDLTPHSLRHSWATMTAKETQNPYVVRSGLGHTTFDMSLKYVKTSTVDLANAGNKVFGDLWDPSATLKSEP